MRGCKLPCWLDGVTSLDGGVSLRYTSLLDVVVDELPRPAAQYPALWLLLGTGHRRAVVKTLVPSARHDQLHRRHSIGLHVPPDSTFEGRPFPVFVLDGDILDDHTGDEDETDETGLPGTADCTPRRYIPVGHTSRRDIPAASLLCSQLLFPFVDVVALFLPDYPDLAALAEQVRGWVDAGPPPTRTRPGRPHLLLIADNDRQLASFRRGLEGVSSPSITTFFGAIVPVVLGGGRELSHLAYYRSVREHLFQATYQVREGRISARELLSARHLSEIVHQRLLQLESGSFAPFDLVRSLRHHHAVAEDLVEHVDHFLSRFRAHEQVVGIALPILATAILMDHYMPEQHRKHSPGVVNGVRSALTEANA